MTKCISPVDNVSFCMREERGGCGDGAGLWREVGAGDW